MHGIKHLYSELFLRENGLLHILILHQSFAVNGSTPGRRFFEIGRRLAAEGHQVTVITGNSELRLPLGQKKIGLQQREGMAIIVLNPGGGPVKRGQKRMSASFARQAVKQGRRLPPPDVVLVSSPPLALAGAASSLGSFYRVPIILEIGEGDDFPTGGGYNLLEKFVHYSVQRSALRAYCRAESIIFTSREAALAAAEKFVPFGMVSVLPDDGDFENTFHEFSKIVATLRLR